MKVEDLTLDRIDDIHIFQAPKLTVGKKVYERTIIIHFMQNDNEVRVYADVEINGLARSTYDDDKIFCDEVMKLVKSKSEKVRSEIMETINISLEMLDLIAEIGKKRHNVSIPINPQNMAEA